MGAGSTLGVLTGVFTGSMLGVGVGVFTGLGVSVGVASLGIKAGAGIGAAILSPI